MSLRTKKEILDAQAKSLANVTKVKDAVFAGIEAHEPIQGKLKLTIVPLTYTYIVEPEEGTTQDEANVIISDYGIQNG